MSPRALALSLALHAGFVTLVGRWSLSDTTGPGDGGASVFAFSVASDGLLLPDAVAAAVEDAVVDPMPVESASPLVSPSESVRPIATVNPAAPAFAVPAAPAIPRELPPIAEDLTQPSRKSVTPRGKPGAKRGVNVMAAGSGLARVGSGVGGGGAGYVPPQYRLRYKPTYPEQARVLRLEGTVLLLVSVDANGRVSGASVRHSCGHELLDRTALAAVRSWRFEPARQNGVAVAAQVEVPLSFRFEERRATRA